MQLMQLIKNVLDDAYSEIELADDKQKDKAIKAKIELLSDKYKKLTSSVGTGIDYSDPIARFAYIYKYTVAHADYVMQIIRDSKDISALFQKNGHVQAACVGGGPGSDFLGILKYMMNKKTGCDLTCYLFDKERAWGDSWSDVARALKADVAIYPIFEHLDVTDSNTWKSYTKYHKSDLFTLRARKEIS